ncbi:Predicted arabinose efflux permease, MFS family [Arcanobacterium phocae]|uniref:Predicted arabinose efflux permease, MFS family n=1 Tax=Arcanobacterium phocae TaxID=131112 RepID=A0A1H2LII6_9ACTO|nr:Predicted arabinose efflux permease, MFS family [Arcanobacterium phocae]
MKVLNPENVLYRKLYTTMLINLIGDAIAQLALPLAFLYATGSIVLASTLATATLTTQLFLTLPLAAIADRLPRRKIVFAGYLVEGACLTALGWLLLGGVVNLAIIVLIGVIRGAVSELGSAASAGYVPQVLGRESMLKFNSRVETIEGVAAIGGPSISGGLVGILGGAYAMFVPAILSFLNGAIYSRLPDKPTLRKDGNEKKFSLRVIAHDVCEGIGYVVKSRTLAAMMAVQFALGATTAGYAYGVVVHLDVNLDLTPWQVGFTMAASGVGGIIASLVLERFVPLKNYRSVLLLSLMGVGVILGTYWLVNSVALASAGLFFLDFCWVGLFIYSGTLSQYVTDDEHLSRVDSIGGLVFLGASSISALLAGLLIVDGHVATYLVVLSLTVIPALVSLVFVKHDQ